MNGTMEESEGQQPYPAPPSMSNLSGHVGPAVTTPTDDTVTIASESTAMSSLLPPPQEYASSTQLVPTDSSPVVAVTSVPAAGVPPIGTSSAVVTNPYSEGLPPTEQSVSIVAPPVSVGQVPVSTFPSENGGSGTALSPYQNTTSIPPSHEAAVNGDLTMQPRRAVSALGGNAIYIDEDEGGKQNAFMRTAPPPNAFLAVAKSTLSPATSGEDGEMHNVDMVTPTSSADQYEDNGDYGDSMNTRSLPLGVPDPDGEDDHPRNTQHSLPNPEDLKLELGASSSQSICLKNPHLFFVVLLGGLFFLILGLSIGLTQQTRTERNSATFHGGEMRLNFVLEFLEANWISNAADLKDGKSPQFKAARWIAVDDKLELGIPRLSPSENDESYAFVSRYVMAVLYYATNGHSWKHDLSFLSEKKTCDWFQVFAPPVGQLGVLCNRNSQQIVGFSFVSNNLEGSLPKELSHLTSVTYMESIGNSLTGSIPDDFQRLTSLQTMVMAFNALTGKLPNWFDKLPKIAFLYLSNNMLTGTIPETLTQSTALSVLALDDNNFKGSVNNVWNLSKLEYLYLEDNDFTGNLPELIHTTHPLLINLDLSSNNIAGLLPADLFRLERIEIIDLHNNAFVGTFPRDINPDQVTLRFVALHENGLSGSIPQTIGHLHKLTHLDLSSNLFTGMIPMEIDHLTDLTYLFLGENNFRKGKIPSWVYGMTQLRELSLKTTQRTGTISDVIAAMDNLVLLDLDDNELTGAIPPDIGMLTNLQFLLLNRNQLTQALPANMNNMESLRFLLLNNNRLVGDISAMCSIESLSVVYVDCGEILCPEDCCKCCSDGVQCHEYDQISNLDPIWEAGYERQFFDFTEATDGVFTLEDDDFILEGADLP
ncbi:RHS repeat-associated core domain containing protein [Nitzschia inconspicua]|uniref:RHS repeat-associated core domain containing protein n=1 Tax=Nitzschia inconspicua TaxID=303405 RepID=A0A9K3PJK4_9STRA|nr:RHS repeat-associated core domain containing protein [Nitzschia inconspicua]